MDRRLKPAPPTDVPPDLGWGVLVVALVIVLAWTGVFETIVEGNTDALRPRRLGLAMCLGGALWVILAWRNGQNKS